MTLEELKEFLDNVPPELLKRELLVYDNVEGELFKGICVHYSQEDTDTRLIAETGDVVIEF